MMTLFITVGVSVVLWHAIPMDWLKKRPEIRMKPVLFSHLPGWGTTDVLPSFTAFEASCHVFLNTPPDHPVGNDRIHLRARDWLPVCLAAQQLPSPHTSNQIITFFQTWFEPIEFVDGKPLPGFFTGYYVPSYRGSLTKSSAYPIPVYGVPRDLITVPLNAFNPAFKRRQPLVGRLVDGNHLVPFYTTKAIDQGAISETAPVIAWVASRIDRLFLQIQGSGMITLPDHSLMHLQYAAQNGAPYTAIGAVLIQQGVMTKEVVSMQHIRTYLETHPDQIKPVLNKNKSFVFFKPSKQAGALGTQGIVLTPGYSMAVDLNWIPMGVPIWLNTTVPDQHQRNANKMQRLMIAQDTGGAIRGPVRGDVFWGSGEQAASMAGKMRQSGSYWVFLPRKRA